MNLIDQVAEYRKTMNRMCGITTKTNYTRVFTDSRAKGVRSKYWQCSNMPIKQMKKFVSAYPTIWVDHNQYEVVLDTNSYFADWKWRSSVSLKFKLIN